MQRHIVENLLLNSFSGAGTPHEIFYYSVQAGRGLRQDASVAIHGFDYRPVHLPLVGHNQHPPYFVRTGLRQADIDHGRGQPWRSRNDNGKPRWIIGDRGHNTLSLLGNQLLRSITGPTNWKLRNCFNENEVVVSIRIADVG